MASERRRASWLGGTRIGLALVVLLVGSWFRTATPAGVDASGVAPSSEQPTATVVAVAAPSRPEVPDPGPADLPIAMATQTFPVDAAWIDATGRSLGVRFSAPSAGCHDEELVVDERPDVVRLSIVSTRRPASTTACRSNSRVGQLTATLAEPLGGRPVVDATTGETIAVGVTP